MERSDVWFVAVTTTVIGFILGLAWSGIGPTGRWLYDYQTLVTGALAVAAAFITVNAMFKAEERQQSRHDELINAGMRADRLTVERAARISRLLRILAEKAQEIGKQPTGETDEPSEERMSQLRVFWGLIDVALRSDMLQASRRLFNPEVAVDYERAAFVGKEIEKLKLKIDESDDNSRAIYTRLIETTIARNNEVFIQLANGLDAMASELRHHRSSSL